LVLPETGAYRARVFAGASDPSYLGQYSFRTYIEVFARPDWFAVEPGGTIAIPRQKFLCNDVWDATDQVQVDLPVGMSTQGGTLIEGTNEIVYAPPEDFVGVDTFAYRLRGQFGGVHVGLATVHVMEGASKGANVVSTIRLGADVAQACLLGGPGQSYRVERSEDLRNWLPAGQITADDAGSMAFEYSTASGSECFYRFPKL
jgi:hypothetical protein